MNPYTRLHAAVRHHIESYAADLEKIDREWIEKHPGVPFLHWTRATGTHMVFLHAADDPIWPPAGVEVPYLFSKANRTHICNQVQVIAECMPKQNRIRATHWFDGGTLHVITTDRAIEIARDYVRATQRAWFEKDHQLVARCTRIPLYPQPEPELQPA